MVDVTQVLQYVANGVAFGAILALGGIGLSLIYGILNLSNFAQGDFVTMGAFAVLFFAKDLYAALPLDAMVLGAVLVAVVVGDRFWRRTLEPLERATVAGYGALLLAVGAALALFGGGGNVAGRESTALVIVASALVSVVVVVALLFVGEVVVWRPLRRRRATALTLVIVSIGVSLVVRNAVQLAFGGELVSFFRPGIPARSYGGVLLTDAQIATILLALLLIALVHVFLRYTRAGKALRALADNADLARVSGIDVDRMVLYVWALTGVLVTVAGVMLTLLNNNATNVNAGANLLLPLFASIILGGLGSAYGAAAGGFVVGIAMKTSALWLGTKYELASAFIILILVLLFRPQGILGGKVA